MARKSVQPAKNSLLRSRAEARLKQEQKDGGKASPTAEGDISRTIYETERLIHELQVHQIELEMQNEELRQTHRIAESALAKFTELYEFAPVGYVTLNSEGRIEESNLACADMLKTNRSAILGQTIGRFVAPASRGLIDQYIRAVLQSRKKQTLELQLRRSDGTLLFVSAGSMGVWDREDHLVKVLIALTDISQRKRMEEELRQSEKRHRHIVEDHAAYICRHKGDGTITFVNEAIAELVGKTKEDLAGANLYDFVPEEDHPVIRTAIASLSMDSPYSRQRHRVSLPDGRVVWHEWISRMVFNPRGQFVEYQAAGRDVTEIHEAQEALREMNETLERRIRQRTKALAKANEDLQMRERELEEESRRLQDANTALKVLLQHREEDRLKLEESILTNVRKLVLPHLEALSQTRPSPVQSNLLNIIVTNLKDLVSPFLHSLKSHYTNLTPREIDVAHLVREGKTAKEIAEILNSSIRSVEFHKANIRTKLGLKNRKVNLRTHLLSLDP